jgi:hypothetical protein
MKLRYAEMLVRELLGLRLCFEDYAGFTDIRGIGLLGSLEMMGSREVRE